MGTGIRPTGLDHAAAALRYWERRQEVVANNLANVNTDGFKGERAFARLLSDGTTPAVDTVTDLRAGPMTTTGAPLDLALSKDHMFVVQTADGERLTRGGSFQIDASRRLTDAMGNAVLGEVDSAGNPRGPINIPAFTANVQISDAGAVMADGRQVGQLRIERIPSGTRLQHEGNGMFSVPPTRVAVPVADRGVRQGMLEESNVESVNSLVDLIAIQRAYASVQKVLSTIDSVRGIAVTELGKPV